MSTQNNRFTDQFKFLDKAAKSVQGLGIQVTAVLNRILPSRVLSKANIFNTAVDVAQDLSTMIMLHVEDSLVENNILIAQKELSVRGLAALSGHQAVRYISSSGSIKLTFDPSIQLLTPTIIIDNPVFRCTETGLKYTVTKDFLLQNLPSNIQSFNLQLIEGTWVNRRFISEGIKLETLQLDDQLPIEHNSCIVTVNGEKWTQADSLYDMGSETKGFFLRNSVGHQIDICFGDDVHGKKLTNGDVILIDYLTSSGEEGNCSLSAEFKPLSGFFDTEGLQIDITNNCKIVVDSGFQLGSYGEDIERTRNIAGYNSRALVFVRPENIKAYLSRLSILSHIDVWTDSDDLVFNLLLLPNLKNKLTTYRDYLTVPVSEFKLSELQKTSIVNYIESSGSQATSTELLWQEPQFDKYVAFVYVKSTVIDRQVLRTKIESVLAEQFLANTFFDTDTDSSGLITQSRILDELSSIEQIQQVNIDFISEMNEVAKINGFYEEVQITNRGSARRSELVKVEFDPTVTNPNLGFDELGGIWTDDKRHIPILRGDFSKWNGADAPVLLTKPVYIFYKTANGYEEL